jgi:hypothetical protein
MIYKNLENIKWRYNNCLVDENGKKRSKPLPMYINSNDLKSLNKVIEYVNDQKKRELNNYHLFAKLYISTLKNELLRNGYNYQLITSVLQSTLKIDFEIQLDSLLLDISQHELQKDINSISEDELLENYKYPKFDMGKMKNRIIEIIQNYIEDECK